MGACPRVVRNAEREEDQDETLQGHQDQDYNFDAINQLTNQARIQAQVTANNTRAICNMDKGSVNWFTQSMKGLLNKMLNRIAQLPVNGSKINQTGFSKDLVEEAMAETELSVRPDLPPLRRRHLVYPKLIVLLFPDLSCLKRKEII